MNSFFKFFTPQDKKFQPLFEQAGNNALNIANNLLEMVSTADLERRNVLYKEIERLEHLGDDITHSIFLELGKNFITPFDREDIHQLASAVDDVTDYIYGTASRMQMYKMNTVHEPIIKISELLVEMCTDIDKAIKELRDLKNIRIIADACIRINSGENQADYVFTMAVARLFEYEKDAIELIKQKEVLQTIEKATDKCEDVANVLESIIVKNA